MSTTATQGAVMAKTEDKKSEPAKAVDGFQNFVARLGVGTNRSQGGCQDNLLSDGHYTFNLITRNRIQLEAAYRGSWIVGQVVDAIADDMTRAGVEVTTNDDPEAVTKVHAQMSRLQIWQSLCENIKWGRLYGGSIAVLQIMGQALSTPLDLETVGKGQFQGLTVYDRWQLQPALDKVIESGPELGLPAYYDIILGGKLNKAGEIEASKDGGRVRVHHSRCIRMEGIKLPYYQAIIEQMWGESILERMWDRLISFDTATMSTGNLINRAQLRMVGVDGLREILAAGGAAQEALVAQFEYMRKLQSNEGITLLDKEDTYESTAYTFAGLSDVLIQFGQQVSGACGIPLVRLFGQSPAGLNATGDGEIRQYYDHVNAQQEARMRNPIEMLLKVLWRSVTGKPAPLDLEFSFTPLWQMSATDKAAISKTTTDTIIAAHQEGAVDTATMMKELKQASGATGLFTHITDEQIEEAENEEPPPPENQGAEGTGKPNTGSEKDLSASLKTTAGDSAWKKIKDWASKKPSKDEDTKAEIARLREEAEKEDDKNNHHKAEALREKARKLEQKLKKEKP